MTTDSRTFTDFAKTWEPTLTVDGDYYVMSGPTGIHRLLMSETSRHRLEAHWLGFGGDVSALPPVRVRLTAAQVSKVTSSTPDYLRHGASWIEFQSVNDVAAAADAVSAYMFHVEASGDGWLQGEDYHPGREAFALRQAERCCIAAERQLRSAAMS